MIFFFPYHKFDIVTKYSPLLVKTSLTSLLKKPDKNNRKFQIYFDCYGFGEEEFTGIVEESYFKLMRYRYLSNDFICMLYKGEIEPSENGSVVHITFRFGILLIIVLLLVLISTAASLYFDIYNKAVNELNNSTSAFVFILLFYIVLMIGFNYRTFVVKDLIMKKLNGRYIDKL